MRSFSRLPAPALVLALAACGPTPPGGATDSASEGEPPATSTGAAPTTGITSTSTTVAGTTTDDGSNTFIASPDVPAHESCDPHAESACPEGQKCSAHSPSDNVIYAGRLDCFPVRGARQRGETCDLGVDPLDGLDDCAAGLVCIDMHMTGEPGPGVCVEFCDPPGAGTPGPQRCTAESDACFGLGCQSCTLQLCLPTCDPLAPDCPDGTACRHESNAFFCFAEHDADLPGAGESCTDSYRCDGSSTCILASNLAACPDADACCTPYCRLSAPNTCPGAAEGETCHPFFPAPFDPESDPWGVKYNDLGICHLP